MSSSKWIKIKVMAVLLGVVSTWIGCADEPPVAPSPAGKATYAFSDADSTRSAAVVFADANLERAVREALDRSSGTLTVADLDSLTYLDASDQDIQSLAGLEHATALRELYLRRNAITDVSPLASLTNLQRLSLWGNAVTDISPLASLTSLQVLSLWGNGITDVSPLASLTKLRWLQLGDNSIADVSSLASLTNLRWLGVVDNAISVPAVNQQLAALLESDVRIQANYQEEDEPSPSCVGFTDASLEALVYSSLINPVRGEARTPAEGCITRADMAFLIYLEQADGNIRSLEGLQYATNLDTLNLVRQAITDVSPLARLTNLRWLGLTGNNITNVGPLARLARLTHAELLSNSIVDVSPLIYLISLQKLYLHNNSIVDVSPFAQAQLPNLQILWLQYNSIVDVGGLASLTSLQQLRLEGNSIVNVQPLVSLSFVFPRRLNDLRLNNNPLSTASTNSYIPQMTMNGVTVTTN